MLEVTISCEEEIQYPIACRSLESGIIVLFLSEFKGVVIKSFPISEEKLGDMSSTWTSCKNGEVWEPVNITITC